MLTGMGHPLLSNSHSIIPNPKSLFNMKEVNITLNEKDIKDLQTILDNAEAYADTHNLKAVFNAVDRIRIHSPRNQVRKILLRISLLRIIPIQPPKRSSTPNTNKVMKRKPKTISKEKAIIIASNHNHIQIAKGYTESELREVLRHLNLKPGF